MGGIMPIMRKHIIIMVIPILLTSFPNPAGGVVVATGGGSRLESVQGR